MTKIEQIKQILQEYVALRADARFDIDDSELPEANIIEAREQITTDIARQIRDLFDNSHSDT